MTLGRIAVKVGIIGARDGRAVKRHLVHELDERILERCETPVALHMLIVDVGDDGDRGPQHQERAIAFISLCHQVVAPPESRVAAEGAQARRR